MFRIGIFAASTDLPSADASTRSFVVKTANSPGSRVVAGTTATRFSALAPVEAAEAALKLNKVSKSLESAVVLNACAGSLPTWVNTRRRIWSNCENEIFSPPLMRGSGSPAVGSFSFSWTL